MRLMGRIMLINRRELEGNEVEVGVMCSAAEDSPCMCSDSAVLEPGRMTIG